MNTRSIHKTGELSSYILSVCLGALFAKIGFGGTEIAVLIVIYGAMISMFLASLFATDYDGKEVLERVNATITIPLVWLGGVSAFASYLVLFIPDNVVVAGNVVFVGYLFVMTMYFIVVRRTLNGY